ncbi:MAG: winged helix-turn-helix domain-containing protein [Pseudomonadales bacterium]|nr:winged helix-turn-helix domain-containing protein [Pseudomonadales bacterium]
MRGHSRPAVQTVYLGDIEVRRALNALVRSGEEVRLEPKVMDVLALLMGRADEVVTRQELLDEVWEGRTVGEETLTRCISELRSALGDSVRDPTFIQTVPKRGYRLLQLPRVEATQAGRPIVSAVAIALLCTLGIAAAWLLYGSAAPLRPQLAEIREDPEARLLPADTSPRTGLAAPDLYVLGRYYWDDRAPESLERALELFNEAIALDPDLARGYAGLADTYLLQASYSGRDRDEAASLAAPLLATALELDPDSADVHASLGILETHNGRPEQAEAALRRAIDLEPTHTMALMWLGNLLLSRGELAESHELYERAYRLDPRQAPIAQNYLLSLMMMGDYAAAEKIGSGYPSTNPGIHMVLADLALEQGNWQRVMRIAADMNHDPVGAELVRWRALSAQNDLPGAERHLRAAARQDSGDARIYLAALEHRTYLPDPREFDAFAETLAPSIESSPKYGKLAQTWQAIDRIGRGQYEGVVAELKAVLDTEPFVYPPYSLQLLGYLLVALHSTGNEEEFTAITARGLELLARASSNGWGSREFHLQSALFLAAAGRLPQARAELKAAGDIGELPVSLLALDPRISTLLETQPIEKFI